MKSLNLPASACRYCRYYQPEGRRGGCCQTLGAPVQGNWKACGLALPAFGSDWEGIEGLEDMVFLSGSPTVLASSSLACTLEISKMESSEQTVVACAESQKKAKPLLV